MRRLRTTWPAVAVLAVTMLAGCATSGAATTGPSAPGTAATETGASSTETPRTDGSPTAAPMPWEAPVPAPSDELVGAETGGEPGGDGVYVGGDPPSDLASPAPGLGLPVTTDPPAIDPCALVVAAEWADWTKEPPSTPIPLERGEACGWINAGDTFRMAIAAPRRSGDTGFVSLDEFASYGKVEGLGDSAVWLTQWPVAQSSTLVITVGDLDVVLEMSSRDGIAQAQLLEAARHFGAIALGRLP